MKKYLTLFALLLSFLVSQAQTVVVDGIKYNLYGTRASVEEYDYENNGQYYKGEIIIPNSITYNEVQYDVVGIGYNAFRNCDKLTVITIPSSVKSIRDYAFNNCSSLASVDLSNVTSIGSEAFSGCSSLASVGDLSNVMSIGSGAFYYCSSLASVDLSNVTSIGDYAFHYCSSLASVGDMSNVTSIGDYAFIYCSSLTSVGDMSNVTSIGSSAFSGCSSLASVDLANVTSIGSSAFSGCSSLTSVGDLSNVTSIGSYVFYYCSSLASVGDMSNVTSIGSNAFHYCSSLASVDLSNVTSIGSEAFSGCSSLASVDLSNVTSIGSEAFSGCSSLESVNLSNISNVSNIGDYVFDGCTSLTSVKLPNTTTIVTGLFQNCPKLGTLNIPASVKEIQDDAFSGDWAILKFNDPIPATIGETAFTGHNLLVVPGNAYTDYYNAWTNYQGQIVSDTYPLEYNVEVVAKQSDSDVLSKVLDGGPQSKALNVVSLKVKGDINSYDIMVMRNKMLNLRNLDLSEADIVPSSYEYYTGYHTTDSVIGPCSFYNLSNLRSVKLPNSVKTISGAAFARCSNLEYLVFGEENVIIEDEDYINNYGSAGAFSSCNLKEISFNEKLRYIGSYAFYENYQLENIELSDSLVYISDYAFQNCSKLTDVTFSPALTSIGTYGFSGCSSLETIMLPTSLKSIGTYAFSGCSKLKNVRIPASIEVIGDYAFNTSSITDIYTWTIEPTNINQNTFHSYLFTKAMLHVPETSSYLYYWDTQWSQFLNFTEFNEPYEYFYLKNKDLVEDEDTPRIEGEDGDNPDADIHPGGGLIVDGDPDQGLGDVVIGSDGSDNAGSIIGGDSSETPSGANVNIDNLTIKIQITANRWYFFSFPFDIDLDKIHFDGQFVWRYYDGEFRAVHGNGAWVTLEMPRLVRFQGYIFQASKSGTLYLNVGEAAIDGKDKVIVLENHGSSNLQNSSWNLVGNPYLSYYPISDMDYSSPITIWNGSTYTAYNPLDDDVTLYPFQAFFVQKPDANTNMGFLAENRITKNQRDDQAVLARARDRRMAKSRSAVIREIVNIEVSDGNATDMTRVVFNEESLGSYELTCDASKFMSTDAPQIYTMDATNAQYSINERPMADGIVRMGFTANHSGVFTISASRLDCPMWLKDVATGVVCDLSTDDFEFTSDAGTFDDRFLLINANDDPTGIADIEGDNDVDAIYYGVNGMRLQNANNGGVTLVKKGSKVEKIYNK